MVPRYCTRLTARITCWYGAQRTLLAVGCTLLIRMEAPSSAYRRGMLAVGPQRDQPHEEETSGEATPRRTNCTVAASCLPGRWTSVSSTVTGRSWSTPPTTPTLRPSARVWHPSGMIASSRSTGSSPGLGWLPCARGQGSPAASGRRSPGTPPLAATPHTTGLMPSQSRGPCVGACSRRPTSIPRRGGRPVLSAGAGYP
jgi:hypothetical protein